MNVLTAAQAVVGLPALRWQRRAVCYLETSGAPELWTSDRRPHKVVAAEMERMCRRCPVRRECAADAIERLAENGTHAGVYVPASSQGDKWAQAMRELQEIADGDVPPALGVPA